MPHPLEDTLLRFRRRARTLSAVEGIVWMIASAVGTVLLLAVVDYVLRPHDAGMRVLLSLLAVGLVIAALRQLVIRRLSRRVGLIGVARAIETAYPSLGTRVSSAIDFLARGERDPLVGSAALRRSVIDDAASDISKTDLARLLDTRGVSRAVWLALPVCAVAAGVALAAPAAAHIALVRLVWPLSDVRWPVDAALAAPADIARLDVTVLPPRAALPSAKNEAAPAPRISPDARSSSSSVDDRRVPAERRRRAARAADRPAAQPADSPVRVARGCRIAFSGRFTQPVRRASLHRTGAPPIAVRLRGDRRSFETDADDFVVHASGRYWFEIEDPSGTHRLARPAWEVSMRHDRPPAVHFSSPATDLLLPPRAALAVEIRATDNRPVAQLSLTYTRSDRREVGELAIGGLTDLPSNDRPGRNAPGLTADAEVVRRARALWFLGPLALPPGVRIDLIARAGDRLGQRAEAVRRIRIVTEPAWIAASQAELYDLVGRLRQAIRLQEGIRRRVAQLDAALRRDAAHTPLEQLRALPARQQRIDRMLLGQPRGIAARIGEQLRLWEASGVERPEQVDRLRRAAQRISALRASLLPRVARPLSTAARSAAAALRWPPPSAEVTRIADALRRGSTAQQSLIDVLNEVAHDLDQQVPGQLADALRALQKAQRRVMEQTRQQLVDAIEQDRHPEENALTAPSGSLAEQQRMLAAQAERLAAEHRDRSEKLDQLGSQMRSAARAIDREHLGQAAEQQRSIAEQLGALAEQRPDPEQERTSGKGRNLLHEKITRLVTAQGELEKEAAAWNVERQDAAPRSRSLLRAIARQAKRQMALHDETKRVANEPSAAGLVGQALAKAATTMQQAAGRLQQRQTDRTTQRMIAQARKQLEEAETQLARQPAERRQTAQGGAGKRRTAGRRMQRSAAAAGSPKAQGTRPAGTSSGEPAGGHEHAAAPGGRGTATPWVKQVWGHLPERIREQMIQSPGERFLPKYQIPLESYYRRLSEEPIGGGGG